MSNRREFLKKVAAGSVAAGSAGTWSAYAGNDAGTQNNKDLCNEWKAPLLQAKNKLNIIWITCDEMTTRAMSVYGNPLTSMPAAEQMAKEGVIFNNTYVQMPKSVPSRASMITSRYPHCEGHRTLTGKKYFDPVEKVTNNNDFTIMAHEPNLIKFLRDQGYKTALIGKNHQVDWNLHQRWFDATSRWDSPEWKNRPDPYAEPQTDEMKRMHFKGKVKEDYDYNLLPDALHARWSIDFIRENKDNPFFALIDMGLPHPPYQELTQMPAYQIPLEKIPMVNPLPLDKAPSVERQYRTSYELEHLKDEDRRRIRRAYYTMCEFADRMVKRIIDEVDRLGLKEKTLIIYTADHGDFNGSRNCFEKWDTMFYDEIVKVPLMMRLPGILPAGKRIHHLVELLDVAPTITEILGYGTQEWMQGKSLLALARGETSTHKDAVFSQGGVEREATLRPAPVKNRHEQAKQKVVHDFPDTMIRSKMIRKDDFKYIYRLAGDHELYNLKEDPEELNNLIHDPSYKEIINEMKDRLLRFTIEYETNYPLIGELHD